MEIDLKNVMAGVFECSVDEVDETSRINAVSGWDSLNHIRLMMVLAEQGVDIAPSNIPDLISFAAIREHLHQAGVSVVAQARRA